MTRIASTIFTLILVFSTAAISYSEENNKSIYHSTRASKYIANGDYIKAIPELTSALKYSPRNEHHYLRRGYCYFNLNNYEKAINDYSKAISINPNNSDAWNNRGQALMAKGHKGKAIKDFEEACNMLNNRVACVNLQDALEDGKSADFFYMAGMTYLNSKDLNNALKYFNKALDQNNNHYDTYIGRGKLHFISEGGFSIVGRHPQTLNDFNKAIMINPKRAEGYVERGKVYNTDKYYQEAFNDYTHAYQLGLNDGKTYYNRGISLSNLLNSENRFKDYGIWTTCFEYFAKSCNLGYTKGCEKKNQFNNDGYLYGTFDVVE